MKMPRMFIAVGLTLILAFALSCTKQNEKAGKETTDQAVTEESTHATPGEAAVDPVAEGKALFADTGLGTNGKSCASCHQDGADLAGKAAEYPKEVEMLQREASVEDVVNLCIVQAMGGTELEGAKMQAMKAYLESL
jgi:mono/diheme cytochrome c family protein